MPQVMISPRGSKRTYEATSADANTPITDVGELLQLEYSTRMERTQNAAFGGHNLCTFKIKPLGTYNGGFFRPGDHVKATTHGGVGFEGEFAAATPQEDGSVEMLARGYAYNFDEYDSVYFESVEGADDISYPTGQLRDTTFPRVPGGAKMYGLDHAMEILGLPIKQYVGPVPTGAWTGVQDHKPTKLNGPLSGLTQRDLMRWAVWNRSLVIDTDPTVPMWIYDAPDSVIGVADTDYRTRVGVLVHRSGGDWIFWAIDEEGLKRFDEYTEVVDYRLVGGSQSTADDLLEHVRGRFLYTGSITIGPDSGLSTPSGGKAPIGFIRAGQMLKIPGMRTGQGNLMPAGAEQFIIGRTEYRWALDGEESLTITPQNAAPRDIASLLAPPTSAGTTLQASSPAT